VACGSIELTVDGAIATVVLSHPGKFNAMSRAMWRRLRELFLELPARADLRCVVVRGEGAQFCAGGDIAEYPAFRFQPDRLRAFHEDEVWGALGALLDCDLPLVAAIAGHCMGAGVEIASCCDIRVAAADDVEGEEREADDQEGAERRRARGEGRADGQPLAEVVQADAQGDQRRHAHGRLLARSAADGQQHSQAQQRAEDDHRHALEDARRVAGQLQRLQDRIDEQKDEQADG